MATVCQTCGDRGFEEALVYCDSCKIEVIHRYCVGIVPVPFTEYITWICEDCDGSDSDSDWLEVDQTAELRQILKKNDTSPVLAVEEHVEPVKVSSPPVKETMKESKSRESSDSGKPLELTGLVRDGASVLEAEKSYSGPDHSSCTRKKNDSGSECKVDETALPVLAVEDNGLQDATNGEPVEVSSSPIKETMKESKSQENIEKPHEFTGLVKNGASILEVGDSSSGPDHNSFTIKGSYGGSDGKEVDQTDKLRHMSKKNEKGKKQNSKKNSIITLPILAVEDHGLQDATNGEPVKVSSSPVKETMKESKRRERSDSGKPHELTGLVRNGASASEVENSSSVPDHSSCTSKRNDSGSDRKEVDQTANLKHILKKGEKKEKRQKKTDKEKKKNKKSSNHFPPVLAVKDHGVQDATNIEPVEVSSSSPIKETMESKRQESSGNRKPHELTGIYGDGTSVSEAENSSSAPYHNFCTTKKRKLSSGNIPLTSENRQLADGNSSCKEAEPNTPQVSTGLTSRRYTAQPIKIPIWRDYGGYYGTSSGSRRTRQPIPRPSQSMPVPETPASAPTQMSIENFVSQPGREHLVRLDRDCTGSATWFQFSHNGISKSINRMINGMLQHPYPKYTNMPYNEREQWLRQFAQEFTWDSQITAIVRREFDLKASRLYSLKMNEWKDKWRCGKVPRELAMNTDVWQGFVAYWSQADTMATSSTQSSNRKSDRKGKGIATHNLGATSKATRARQLFEKEGVQPFMLRLLEDAHTSGKTGLIQDPLAREIIDNVRKLGDEYMLSQAMGESAPHCTEVAREIEDAFIYDSTPKTKGRVFGLPKSPSSASSSFPVGIRVELTQKTAEIEKMKDQIQDLQQNVEEERMRRQASETEMEARLQAQMDAFFARFPQPPQ